MTDSDRFPHNVVKLRLPDGRVVSLAQGSATSSKYLESVEVWVDGEPDPVGHLSWQQLVDYVSGLPEHEADIDDDDLADWAAEDEAIFLNEDRLRQGRQQ